MLVIIILNSKFWGAFNLLFSTQLYLSAEIRRDICRKPLVRLEVERSRGQEELRDLELVKEDFLDLKVFPLIPPKIRKCSLKMSWPH